MRKSIQFLAPEDDDSLDIHIEDLDSFKNLSDEQNMCDDYMFDDDAETEVFDSADSSSNFKPDTTTSSQKQKKFQIQAENLTA